MILIADAGSTKTDWLLLRKRGDSLVKSSKGLNPTLIDPSEIKVIIADTFSAEELRQQVRAIYFFGAGCWNDRSCLTIHKALAEVFEEATIQVSSDLLGAVRATCGDQAGLVAILGTGSNTCLYDGQKISQAVQSLGYIIGDEGSGSYFGKELVRLYFYKELPVVLHQLFAAAYELDKQSVIENVYQKKGGNRFLASFVPFLAEHRAHPFVEQFLKKGFHTFIDRHILKYPQCQEVPIHFIGSIAFHFKKELGICLQEKGLQLGVVLPKPIEALGDYFIKKREQKAEKRDA